MPHTTDLGTAVSVIATVKNEAESVRPFLDSLLAQSRSADEIILADGGSTDGTVEIIQEYIARGAPIRLIHAPGANIAQGRNQAIEAAAGPIIAVTDAGSRADPDWLRHLVAPFENDPATTAVAGFFKPTPLTALERCTVALLVRDADEVDPTTFMPSSRSVAFRKAAWFQVGGYPESLNWAEDTLFDRRLVAAGHRFVFAPQAVVYWRPRSNLRAIFRQYHRYAQGDGQAWLTPLAYLWRAGLYVFGILLLGLGFRWPWLWVMLLCGWAIYLAHRSRRAWKKVRDWQALFLIPLLVTVNDLADITGFLRGAFRLKGCTRLSAL